jgi:hypothetical protein
LAFALVGCGADAQPTEPVAYGPEFNQTWRDGKAEMAAYDLIYPRYGERRTGTAVAVTVTEPFLPGPRVKADRAGGDSYGVLKLNLAEDFQTGVYDYNLMTSVFVATEPANGLPAGAATKVSFSAQEWCGHVYQQALFSKDQGRQAGVRQDFHSYFEGQADQQTSLGHPAEGIAEDALILWARGLAGPAVPPRGGAVTVPTYRSLAIQRLQHVEGAWDQVTLTRQDVRQDLEVPAGTFSCEVAVAEVSSAAGDRTYTFYVDTAEDGDRRLVKMTRSDGYELTLRGAERLPYWNQNGNADEDKLESFGLERRAAGRM